MRRIFLACLFACFIFFTAVQAQTVNPASLLKQLLELPAPPPVDEKVAAALSSKTYTREPEFFDENRVPPDDAPIEDLLAYWSAGNRSMNNPQRRALKPSEKTLARILEHCEENPLLLTAFINLYPPDPKIAETVKGIYDKLPQDEANKYSSETVKRWLTYNSIFFIDELAAKAENVRDKDRYVTNYVELLALARVDWERAAPILERLSGDSSQPVSRTLSHWAYYARAIETENEADVTKYRRLLQEAVENRALSPGNRDLAMDALVVEKEWEGREDWYLSLLSDETLYQLESYSGLTTILRFAPPEKMIPAMAKLVADKHPAVRKAAVRNLLSYVREGKPEAVRALLPWLSDPNWMNDFPDGRRSLIFALGKVDLPESVPALITIVMNEEEYRQTAAEALGKYKDPRAVPALKIALANEKIAYRRIIFIQALDECGGLNDDEKMSALELYAATVSTPEGAAKFNSELYGGYTEKDEKPKNPVPVALLIGNYVAAQTEPADGVVVRAVERLKTLRKTKPAVAAALSAIMQKWKGRLIYIEKLRQIRTGEADLEMILAALAQRREIFGKTGNDVFAMRAAGGIGRGIAACLAEDDADLQSVLRQTDASAKTAMLGCARLIRAKLPVAEVGALLKNADKTLALAAERYLESEDSPQARTIILERRPGEAVILGARQAFVPDPKNVVFNDSLRQIFQSVTGRGYYGENHPALDKTEAALRDEIKSNPDLLAIYGLLPNKPAGQAIIRVFKDKIVFTSYEDAARYRERTLSAKEYEDFYRLLIEEKIDSAIPFLGYCEECDANEFVMFGKNGGRRVYFNDFSEDSPVKKLVERFRALQDSNMKLHYRLADKVKGLEVLLADERRAARAVWKNGGDLRVLIEDKDRQEEIRKDLQAQFESEGKAEFSEENFEQYRQIIASRERRQRESENAHFFWRGFENGALGAVLPQPPEMPYLYDETQFPETPGFDSEPRAWQVRAGGGYEIKASHNESGLYKVSRSQTPVRFKEGNYDLPIVTADGNWVIASKVAGNWQEPKNLVRIDLQTGKEFPVNIPPADTLNPVTFVASQNKVLVYRAKGNKYYGYRQNEDEAEMEVKPKLPYPQKDDKNPSPIAPEYYLLDAATGAAQLVKGEFRPLEDLTYRPLQATGAADEFWAAVYDKKAKETAVGRYNTKTFTFQPVTTMPEIKLGSMDIWVDEKEAKVYFVYEGHLLSAPLQNQ